MKMNLCKIMKSKRGGIPTIITIIATTIAAMGLFSYTILNQAATAKETGDKALMEQNKLNMMLENQDYVTGKIVLNYVDRLGDGSVEIYKTDGITVINSDDVDNQAIFSFEPTYNADGKMSSAKFIQINIGS